MNHDLRAPLHTILGFAQFIDSDTPPPTLAQTACVEQILRAGWQLLGLIDEMVDLALMESGKLRLSIEPTSLTEVLRECQAMTVPRGRKRGIGMTFPPSDVPYFVGADRARLKQVLISCLLAKTKKELSILCGHPQHRKQIPHANSEMFVMLIDRCGMVRLGV
jgi:signal transduction histidine kinase